MCVTAYTWKPKDNLRCLSLSYILLEISLFLLITAQGKTSWSWGFGDFWDFCCLSVSYKDIGVQDTTSGFNWVLGI